MAGLAQPVQQAAPLGSLGSRDSRKLLEAVIELSYLRDLPG